MYITLISACEKRALKRTRAVLDSYALRIGERTWGTPITAEGLREMRALLRRGATRQTAVACYRNQGQRQMTLLWVVGARGRFGPDGHYPAGTRALPRRPPPMWVRAACLLAQAAGLGHDLGKTSRFFTEKLARAVAGGARAVADPVRHEWLSMRLLQLLRAGHTLDDAWSMLGSDTTLKSLVVKPKDRSKTPLRGLGSGIDDAWDAFDFLVATHHKLFGPLTDSGCGPDPSRHLLAGQPLKPEAAATAPEALFEDLNRTMGRLDTLVGASGAPAFWRGVAMFARAALILADHEVSSKIAGRSRPHPYATRPSLHANTLPDQSGYNQNLGWHLEEVSRVAADRAYRIASLRLPSLSAEAVDQVLTPADEGGPFAWQNRAVAAARRLAEREGASPLLVLNIAATGSGKTRLNAQLACVLNPRPRFAVALNLRTLTLQTGDALRALGIGEDELATVIGDRPTARLHAWQHTSFDLAADETDRANEEPVDSDYEAFGGEVELPEWMGHLLEKRPAWRSILGAPVLASTIDFLINAGEPGRQGNHVAALLRLADSDLILDEIDGYDPKALVAVLRLVQTAALLGRHVICSSATLAVPIADALQSAFASGARMRAALEGRDFRSVALIVDDRCAPTMLALDDQFKTEYLAHARRMIAALPSAIYRRPYWQSVAARSEESWRESVLTAVTRLDQSHAWSFADTGKRVSFGLVRVANIRTAIPLARFLAKRLPHARVACYHGQDFRLARFHKERRLDWLLTRKRGNARIERDAEIRALVAQSAAEHVPFIVVATPVEEIGRDHDFDWAVLEPSSTHSLVQAAGRVNRHRLEPVTAPNIAILQYNARWARKESVIFCKPGLESSSEEYPSHDLFELLDWSRLDALDARLRFSGEHRFAEADERILTRKLASPMKILRADPQYPSSWMTEGFYRTYPLREHERGERWRLVIDAEGQESFQLLQPCLVRQDEWLERKLAASEPRAPNDWLTLSAPDLLALYEDAGIDSAMGLEVTVKRRGKDKDALCWDRSFGFAARV